MAVRICIVFQNDGDYNDYDNSNDDVDNETANDFQRMTIHLESRLQDIFSYFLEYGFYFFRCHLSCMQCFRLTSID